MPRIKSITWDIGVSEIINDVLAMAIEDAKRNNCVVEFIFNDVGFCITPKSDLRHMLDLYHKRIDAEPIS